MISPERAAVLAARIALDPRESPDDTPIMVRIGAIVGRAVSGFGQITDAIRVPKSGLDKQINLFGFGYANGRLAHIDEEVKAKEEAGQQQEMMGQTRVPRGTYHAPAF